MIEEALNGSWRDSGCETANTGARIGVPGSSGGLPGLRRMQTAFLAARRFPPPASCADILARRHRAGAGFATDARKAAIVERIVGDAEEVQVGPDFLLPPVRERTEFLQAVRRVVLLQRQARPGDRLLAAQARDPGALAGEGTPQRLHLAHLAAGFAAGGAVGEYGGSVHGGE